MSAEVSKEKFAQLKEQLRSNMARTALLPFSGELNFRMASLLQSIEIIEDFEAPELSEATVNVLVNRHSELSIAPKGPLLLIKESERNISMLEPSELICHTDSSIRSGIVTHLLVQKEAHTLSLSETTFAILSHPDITSSDRRVWVPAAVKLYDCLRGDFQYHLSCLKQSLLLSGDAHKQTFGQFAHKVLNPSLEILESVLPTLTKPTKQVDAIEAASIRGAEQCASLEDYLDMFFKTYGFVPLLDPISAAGWLVKWRQHHKVESNVLETILWNWAERQSSVIALYHVCQIFLSTTDLLSEIDNSKLWEKIRMLPRLVSKDQNASVAQHWRIRAELSQMYCKRLEVLFPGQDGETLACHACLLADQVGSLFDKNPQSIPSFLSAIENDISITANTWLMGRSKIGPSALRYSVLFQDSIWTRSIAFEIAQVIVAKGILFVPDDIRRAAVESLMSLAIEGIASGSDEDEKVFPFAQATQLSVVEWQKVETDPAMSALLKETIDRIEKQKNDEFLIHQLRTPQDLDDTDQLFVAVYLRQLAFSNTAPTSEIWEILKNDELRMQLFRTFKEPALDSLLQAFLEMQLQEEDRWNYSLPHILARSATELKDDEDRFRTLALYTVFCSLNVDAVGAIDRLMVDSNDQLLTKLVKRWIEIFDAVKLFAPQWVRARHRALSVVLHKR